MKKFKRWEPEQEVQLIKTAAFDKVLNVSISLGEAAKDAAREIYGDDFEKKQIRRIKNKLSYYKENFQNFEFKEKDEKERIELYKLQETK